MTTLKLMGTSSHVWISSNLGNRAHEVDGGWIIIIHPIIALRQSLRRTLKGHREDLFLGFLVQVLVEAMGMPLNWQRERCRRNVYLLIDASKLRTDRFLLSNRLRIFMIR